MPEDQPLRFPLQTGAAWRHATVFVARDRDGLLPFQAAPLLHALGRLGAVTLVICGNALKYREWQAAFSDFVCLPAPEGTPLEQAYRIGLTQSADHDADQTILCDDRCFGPVGALDPLLAQARSCGADVWAAFARPEESQGRALPDDRWLVVTRKARQSELFGAWCRGEAVTPDGTLSGLLRLAGLSVALRPTAGAGLRHPLADLDAGFALIPAECLRSSRHTGDSISQLLAAVRTRAPAVHAAALAEMEIARFEASPGTGFSLIVPALPGQEAALRQTVGAVLAQTHPKVELIVVATPGAETADLDREIAAGRTGEGQSGERLRLIAGTGAADGWQARNIGLALARYDWILWPDPGADLPPATLGRLADAIAEYPHHETFLTRNADAGGTPDSPPDGRDSLAAFVHRRELACRLGGFDPQDGALAGAGLIQRYARRYPPLRLCLAPPLAAPRPTQPAAVIMHRRDDAVSTVSTVIVSYNHQDFIAEAIESALAQRTPFPHEILISDDGSEDGTGRIVTRYAARYPDRIRNIGRSGNYGISENYRHCFGEARGRFIAILEGDDYWNDPDKTAKQADVMMTQPDVGLVFSRYVSLDMADIKLRRLASQETLPPFLTGADFAALPSLNYIVNLSCIMVRRAAMLHAPACLYDPRLSEIALAFYMDRIGRIGFLNEVMTVYRLNQGSVWYGADQPERLRQAIAVRKAAIAVARPEYRMQILERLREKETELAELTQGAQPR